MYGSWFFYFISKSFFEASFFNYLFALVFLGIGWNFLYLSGTGLLVISYREKEKYKAQGFNDILVFSIQALASLSAGYMLSITSWKTMNLIAVPFLIVIILCSITSLLKVNKSILYGYEDFNIFKILPCIFLCESSISTLYCSQIIN